MIFLPQSLIPLQTKRAESKRGQGSEIKKNTYLYQPIAPLDPNTVQNIIQLLESILIPFHARYGA